MQPGRSVACVYVYVCVCVCGGGEGYTASTICSVHISQCDHIVSPPGRNRVEGFGLLRELRIGCTCPVDGPRVDTEGRFDPCSFFSLNRPTKVLNPSCTLIAQRRTAFFTEGQQHLTDVSPTGSGCQHDGLIPQAMHSRRRLQYYNHVLVCHGRHASVLQRAHRR